MKYGFSKKQLKNLLQNVGIEYHHFPGLGIASHERKNLSGKQDYQRLFARYENTTLKQNTSDLNALAELLEQNKRIALTCFEADQVSCHRSHTAAVLSILIGEQTTVVHL